MLLCNMRCCIGEKFGHRIALLRQQKGLSQEKFAEICDMHRTYIGAIERGEKSPTLTTIEKIAIGLDIEISELFINL